MFIKESSWFICIMSKWFVLFNKIIIYSFILSGPVTGISVLLKLQLFILELL